MITPELVSFIKSEVAKGKNNEQIKFELMSGGQWKENDISEAFSSLNKVSESSSFLQVLLTIIFVLSSIYLIVEILLLAMRIVPGILFPPVLIFFGLIFPVYNAISIPVFSVFAYPTFIALIGIVLFVVARYRGLKVKKYFLIIFILVSLISILDINNVRENAKEDNIRLTQMKSDAEVYFNKLSEEFSTLATLGDIEIFYSDHPEGGSYILFSVNGKLYDEDTGTRTGVGFRYDYCSKNSQQDNILQGYFNEHKKVIVEVPNDYSKYTLGYPGSTEVGITNAEPVLIKDETGNIIPEFYNLVSRCSYRKFWLPDSYAIEHDQAPPPVIY